ncbi:MAG TPA: GNAT family N-acetyltransferase [Pyrinomonadaceae bacterium]|jgi:ribosomal-protein-alanine N-acetyltransferase
MPEIETARLRLRPFVAADLDDLARLCADPEVMRYIGLEAGRTLTRAETQYVLDTIITFWRTHGYGRWAVLLKTTGRLIGLCGLRQLDGEPELMYAFEQASWGQGLAAEAARASLRYGFEEVGLERIVAVTRHANAASQRVLVKIGMRYEGEARPYGVETLGYALTRAEFAPDDSSYLLRRD